MTTKTENEAVRKAGDRRRLLAEFALQDEALRLKEAGSVNREIGRTLDVQTPTARRLAEVAERRRGSLAGVIPHPDPASLELTGPEKDLMLAAVELQILKWAARDVAAASTTDVGPRVGRSRHWATQCAHKRIDVYLNAGGRGLGLVQCSNNAYLTMTAAGWGVALALWPEAFDGIMIPDASHRPRWMRT